jgi:hypothetical protein
LRSTHFLGPITNLLVAHANPLENNSISFQEHYMSIVIPSFDGRHFVCALPAEPLDSISSESRSSLEVWISAMLTQWKNPALPKSEQDRDLHTINSVSAKLLRIS